MNSLFQVYFERYANVNFGDLVPGEIHPAAKKIVIKIMIFIHGNLTLFLSLMMGEG